jgi:hypothetical protein
VNARWAPRQRATPPQPLPVLPASCQVSNCLTAGPASACPAGAQPVLPAGLRSGQAAQDEEGESLPAVSASCGEGGCWAALLGTAGPWGDGQCISLPSFVQGLHLCAVFLLFNSNLRGFPALLRPCAALRQTPLHPRCPPLSLPPPPPSQVRSEDKQMKVRMMLPMTVRCNVCGTFMYKGTKFNTRMEDVRGETYLGIKIFRCGREPALLASKVMNRFLPPGRLGDALPRHCRCTRVGRRELRPGPLAARPAIAPRCPAAPNHIPVPSQVLLPLHALLGRVLHEDGSQECGCGYHGRGSAGLQACLAASFCCASPRGLPANLLCPSPAPLLCCRL